MEILKPKLSVRNLCKSYDGKVVFKDLSFDLMEGEFLSILGPSGCGKTTLLRILIGLEKADGGEILKNGADISSLSSAQRGMGIVFQNYALFPNMTVLQNVQYALTLRKDTKKQAREIALRTLEQVGLTDQMNKKPAQLSGGQQQRVAIARALVSSDAVIVMDEPITNLDAKLREEMLIEIRQIQKNIGTTIFYITHDQEASLQLCDKMAIMDQNGKLCQLGADEDIILRPSNRFVFEFIGVSNFFTLSRLGGDWCFAGNRNLVFDGTVPAQFDKAGTVDMGVRPNNITFDPASPVKAKVKRSVFLGSEYDYFVEFDGREVRVQKNAFDAMQTGAVEQEGDTVGLKFVGPEFYPTAGKEEAV